MPLFRTFLLSWACSVLSGGLVQAQEADLFSVDGLYDRAGIEMVGFLDVRGGFRLQDDPDEKTASIGESRLRLELTRNFSKILVAFKADFLADAVTEELLADIRDLHALASPLNNMDMKIGRQVLTWGTGDLIFINDMFAKDWQSFFIGRDDEYLKAPSDAIKVSLFFDLLNMDLVYSPLFGGSDFITGERLSYFNPAMGEIVGRSMILDPVEPNRFFQDDEISLRLSRNFNGLEAALYGYWGFWQEPEGVKPDTGQIYFPRLNVYGGSVRTSLYGGIGNMELGYYESIDNINATDPFIRPSEFRFLVGYERELAEELTGSLQYYLEIIESYDNYLAAVSPAGQPRDEYRHLLTMRLTKLLMQQNLTLSLFVYYSPSDQDGYARPQMSYKLTDHWIIDGGANLFWGDDVNTFWGQFQDNSNAYAGFRYSF